MGKFHTSYRNHTWDKFPRQPPFPGKSPGGLLPATGGCWASPAAAGAPGPGSVAGSGAPRAPSGMRASRRNRARAQRPGLFRANPDSRNGASTGGSSLAIFRRSGSSDPSLPDGNTTMTEAKDRRNRRPLRSRSELRVGVLCSVGGLGEGPQGGTIALHSLRMRPALDKNAADIGRAVVTRKLLEIAVGEQRSRSGSMLARFDSTNPGTRLEPPHSWVPSIAHSKRQRLRRTYPKDTNVVMRIGELHLNKWGSGERTDGRTTVRDTRRVTE